jgi:nicotinamidase-related amidase
MNIDMNINAGSSVLLLLDVQVGIVNMLPPSEQMKILGNLARATIAARAANLPVIHVMVGYRPNYPEASARNSQVSRVKKEGRLLERAADARICPEIEVRPEDVIVTKKRGSAFFGTDLEIILRAANIDTLMLAGISSLMTVESTARDAFDRDYRLFVLGDCCSDGDVKANEVALTILLPRVSTVCTTDQFCNGLERKNE